MTLRPMRCGIGPRAIGRVEERGFGPRRRSRRGCVARKAGGVAAAPSGKDLRGENGFRSSGGLRVTLRRLIVAVYLLLFLALGVASGVYFWEAREEYNRLKQIEAASRRRLAELEARLVEQEKILERLRNDPVYVEKVIRRRLGYARPEEFIFRFED